jgi:cardiolipin synthase
MPNPIAIRRSRFGFRFALFLLLALGASTWLIVASISPHQPEAGAPPRLYSNQLQQDLRLTLVDAIRKAHHSIHLVMFGLSDPAILDALSKQTVPTTIYYDPTGSPNLWTTLPKADLHPVHSYGLMHQKILIIDNETVFLGSANMTTASLRMHDNLVIGLKNKKIAQFLTDKSPNSSGYLQTSVAGQRVEIWLLPDPRGHALADLRKKIRNAAKSIKIALFTLTHPALLDEIIAAHDRHIDVQVVIDLHSSLGASRKAIDRLRKANIPLYQSQGIQLLHHKFILIDDHTLLTGSANWTKAAFYKNSDCFLALHALTPTQKSSMNRLWTRILGEALEMKKIK